jgi:hypothetical protein
MDDKGVIVRSDNVEEQIKNCYKDLEKILPHDGYTQDDVVAEHIDKTNMDNALSCNFNLIFNFLNTF